MQYFEATVHILYLGADSLTFGEPFLRFAPVSELNRVRAAEKEALFVGCPRWGDVQHLHHMLFTFTTRSLRDFCHAGCHVKQTRSRRLRHNLEQPSGLKIPSIRRYGSDQRPVLWDIIRWLGKFLILKGLGC